MAPTSYDFYFVPAVGNGDLFYKVANAVQNLELLNAAEVLSALTLKADKDFSNISDNAKRLSSGYAMPSDTYVDLTLGASGSTYTAPANGWFSFYCIKSVAGYTLLQNTANRFIVESRTTANNTGCGVCIPVRKNDVVVMDYDGTNTNTQWRFYYAEGSAT